MQRGKGKPEESSYQIHQRYEELHSRFAEDERVKVVTRRFQTFVVTAALLMIGVYVFGGAAVFRLIEGRHEIVHANGTTIYLESSLMSEDSGILPPSLRPDDWNYLNSLYFVSQTLTTVGFGDMTPATTGGRVFNFFFALSGLALVGFSIVAIAELVIDFVASRTTKLLFLQDLAVAKRGQHAVGYGSVGPECSSSSASERERQQQRGEGRLRSDVIGLFDESFDGSRAGAGFLQRPVQEYEAPTMRRQHAAAAAAAEHLEEGDGVVERAEVVDEDEEEGAYRFDDAPCMDRPVDDPRWDCTRRLRRFWASNANLLICLLLATVWIVAGALAFSWTEEEWSVGNAFYFCFVSITTIGYGDLLLTSNAGKAIWCVWEFVGIGILTTFLGIAGRRIMFRLINRERQRRQGWLLRQLGEAMHQLADEIIPSLQSAEAAEAVGEELYVLYRMALARAHELDVSAFDRGWGFVKKDEDDVGRVMSNPAADVAAIRGPSSAPLLSS